MKHTSIKLGLMSLIIAWVASGCNVTSHTEKAQGVDFSGYKTFSWAAVPNQKKSDRSDNDIIDNNIKNSVSQELIKKGWTETENNPAVLLDYTIAVQRGVKRESDPVYSYPYTQYLYRGRRVYSIWYPSTLLGVRSQNVPFREGELTVNMIDSKTNKLIWQGWAKGEINSKNVTTKEVNQRVKSIFKKFDYPG
jgi:hypothetical protein